MKHNRFVQLALTLIILGGGWRRSHYPLSKNHDFSRTEHLLNLRPVCKLKFVRCGQIEEKTERSIYPGLVVAH